MTTYRHLRAATLFAIASCATLIVTFRESAAVAADGQRSLPNVVLIFTDDQGYGDVGCYGAQGYSTPNLDRMAAEGARFTNFYVAQAVCSASRSALLTGCLPNRIGILGALGPASKHGIHERELLLSEVFKQKGYATAIFGKWHLGHHEKFLPTNHGFDEYYGLPYSNDMWPYHPTAKFPALPLFEGTKVVNDNVSPADQKLLTTTYTERTIKFIERHKDQPFFVYLPHSLPHVPLYCLDENENKSEQGRYGDVIQEIDAGVGKVLAKIKELGLDETTLVIFTCDNGPWLSYGNHAGSAGPLREGKGTSWEGGVRVPCIARWPGKIQAGKVQHELGATIDLLPTLAHLIGAELPKHQIDGQNIWSLFAGEQGSKSPHDVYYYYWGNELQAVRSGNWKLHFPHTYRALSGTPGRDGKPSGYSEQRCGLELYDLENDIGERHNVADKHPEVVEKLKALAEKARDDLGDSLQSRKGKNVREPGKL
jgi:arylsulfatase A-like enzyme